MRSKLFLMLPALFIFLASCSTTSSTSDQTDTVDDETETDDTSTDSNQADPTMSAGEFNAPGTFGEPPTIPASYDPELDTALNLLFSDTLGAEGISTDRRVALTTLAESGDPRMAWYVADLLRFFGASEPILQTTAETLIGTTVSDLSPWGELTDRLIAWDIPAPPGYVTHKRSLFGQVEPQWAPFFDETADTDYRYWSWGGVGIDDRPFDRTDEPCNCIPAADNPPVTDAAGGDWYDDDRIVFGVEINGEARAYPRNIMEIREMVNDTVGGRDIAMPYCTLCGSAQVYFTDQLPGGVERPVLRTSGLLSRSNKVMYDITSGGVFDTFLGTAVTGPLAEQGLELEQASVVTTTWGEWKAAHPDTTILAESLALGRDSDLLNTRDADGPIFPIGEVDPRLGVQEPVLGVITAGGQPLAFVVADARSALQDGETVEQDGITVELAGGGVRALDADGNELGSHQAFWFAWSQFYPDTELWTR